MSTKRNVWGLEQEEMASTKKKKKYINSVKIDFVSQFKYLGVIIDPQLTFSPRVVKKYPLCRFM